VIAEKKYVQNMLTICEHEPKIEVAAALEKARTEFAYRQAAVDMWTTKRFSQVKERHPALIAAFLRKQRQFLEDLRINPKWFFQASS
jgi:1,2-phenylacetyl-CoA epoxidase PaaB subunit